MILRISTQIGIMRAMILLGVCKDIGEGGDYVQELNLRP